MKKISSMTTLLSLACLSTSLLAQTQPSKTLPPIDPQKVQDQDDMSWADYHPIPGVDWADTAAHKPAERTIKVALIAADFPDQDFVITMKKGSDIFGNPQLDPIKREEVAKYYSDFWNSRSETHHKHTVNEYWMEQSHGKIGVSFTPYGPYKMPKNSFQYGLAGFGQNNSAPNGLPVQDTMVQDVDRLWQADAGNVRNDYQLVLRMFAGYDETCVWQEFGEMKFQDKDHISPEFGNPDPTMPRWAPTRYEPWTSWKAAQWLWSNSSIIQGECSGSIVHEVSHAAFRIGDNNNNPYIAPYRRVGSGPWDIMDRGSFNGPGGPHDRWEIPVVKGGAMPAGIMLRNKINFGFVTNDNIVRLSREGLAKSGPVVVTVISRAAAPGADDISGIVVNFDGTPIPLTGGAATGGGGRGGRGGGAGGRGGRGGAAPGTTPAGGTTLPAMDSPFVDEAQAGGGGPGGARDPFPTAGGDGGGGAQGGPTTQDRTPWVDPATDPLSPGVPNFSNYTVEVVQRVGYDSFCPDSGVLLAKNKNQASSNGGPNAYTVFNWAIDAHPEDINKLDFKRPDGTPVMRTVADYRQLNDCLFHAGTNSGSQYEYEDAPNRLHFYIIDRKIDDKGFLTYKIGVRSLDGSGPQTRALTLVAPDKAASAGSTFTPVNFTLKNSGKAADTDPSLHPQNTSRWLDSDIYRISATVEGAGWTAQLQNNLAAVKFGDAATIPVFVTHDAGVTGAAKITLTAVSESDPTKKETVTCQVTAAQ